MMLLMKAELAKIKRKGFLFLAFLGAFGVVAMQMVNYGVRKEWLMQQNPDYWQYYLLNIQSFIPIAIVLGGIILTIQITNVEEETNAWKQQLALPISKKSLYLAKFLVIFVYLILAASLLFLFTLMYGIFLDFKQPIPFLTIVKESFLPVLATLPIIALQLWISVVSKSQTIAITIGIVNFLLTYSAFSFPEWVPWRWPYLGQPLFNIGLGVVAGALLLIVGMYDFYRKDAK
ncbi:ABC transporter permease [Lysinibacillus alkalisoli]|uniref:ABC transporter permease n=1 Tax=Lysinibacillus alkalisoli TaxID=1911548 RepID=A0A917LJD7_9BACI|nr:ABC transporter permease [Lysinibacillus alkalisoli]GGG30582.1 ABC transporter permease [Lysinibacillus alkalisoli]